MAKSNIKHIKLWWVLSAASAVGLLASFIQTIERIDYARNPKIPLTCDVNTIFSCSNVFDAWQSSVFGFSNSLMCIVFFTLSLGVGLAGATGSQLARNLRYVLHFFAVFFLGFGAWYLWQSTYKIGYICIFCIACYGAVIAMNATWLRLNADNLFAHPKAYKRWQRIKAGGTDLFMWALWAIAISAMIIFHFW